MVAVLPSRATNATFGRSIAGTWTMAPVRSASTGHGAPKGAARSTETSRRARAKVARDRLISGHGSRRPKAHPDAVYGFKIEPD